jgi:hypothetical protein
MDTEAAGRGVGRPARTGADGDGEDVGGTSGR